MYNFIKRAGLIVIFALFVIAQQSAFAQYEVINAKTVANDNEPKANNKENEIIPTFNDPELPNFSQDSSVSAVVEKKFRNFLTKRKQKRKDGDIVDITNEDVAENIELRAERQKEAFEEQISERNKFKINADKITYDETEGNIYAKGHVELISTNQGVRLLADNAVLDKDSHTIQLRNNVKVIKAGVEMKGEYLLVDLNEQNILMDNPTAEAYSFSINAQEGYLIANDLEMINGSVKSTKDAEYNFYSRGFMRIDETAPFYTQKKIYTKANATYKDPGKQAYKINAKEILINSYKDHNALTFKSADIYYNNHKIVRNSDIEILSDKSTNLIETSVPEFGTLRNFGTFLGYGFVHKLPKGQTLKLMPALVYGDSEIGIGLIGRHKSRNSTLEAGWATSTENLVARGRYNFGHGLDLRYGRNAYLSEGFMGARRSGYAAQLEYKKSYLVDDLDARFSHGIYAGIFSDYQKHRQEHAYATTRFRYMAELTKSLAKYENKEQDLKIELTARAQAGATLYGSGETMGIVRLGPYLTTKVRRWESNIGYLISGVYGDTPFDFDIYRYGKSTIMLSERFHFSDKLALGVRINVSPLKDNPEEDLLTETRIYAIVGPKDLKLAFSYDFVRDIAHLDFMFLVGSDSSRINFERLITKDIDGRQEKRDFYKNSQRVKIEVPENI